MGVLKVASKAGAVDFHIYTCKAVSINYFHWIYLMYQCAATGLFRYPSMERIDAVFDPYFAANTTDARCIYNTANFYIRNTMTGIRKSLEEWIANETDWPLRQPPCLICRDPGYIPGFSAFGISLT